VHLELLEGMNPQKVWSVRQDCSSRQHCAPYANLSAGQHHLVGFIADLLGFDTVPDLLCGVVGAAPAAALAAQAGCA